MPIHMSGIAIGNGWVDAMKQGPAPIDYAYWHGLIDSPTKDKLWNAWGRCEKKMHMEAPFHDFTIPDECNIMGTIMDAAGANIFPKSQHYAPNIYDVTTWDNYPVLNTDVTTVSTFFNNPDVKRKMNFGSKTIKWAGCIPGAGRRRLKGDKLLPGQILLAHDQPESVVPYIAELLDDAGIRVLIYAGDRDISVSLQGSEKVLNEMTWSGEKDWKDADRYLWTVDGDVAGYVKTHKNLEMLLVMNSGHLVPYNVPVQSLDLISRLTENLPFGDMRLPKIETRDTEPETAEVSDHPWNAIRHHLLLVLFLAISCFGIGASVGFTWKSTSSSSYEKIPDEL